MKKLVVCCAASLLIARWGGPQVAQVVPTATPITSTNEEWFWPSWSPNGDEIVATAKPAGGTTDVYVLRPDGSGLRPVGQGQSSDRHPRWVGNDLIAFDSDRHGKYDLFSVRPDGSDLRRLTTHEADDAAAFPSPDGKWIAFTSNRTGRWGLYLVRPDGTGERILAEFPKHLYSPAWSADAASVVFTTATPNADLYEVTVERGGARPFVASEASETMARWSPDSRRLVFLRGDGATRQLMIVGADSEGTRAVPVPGGELSWLAWCPDNRRVVFTRVEAGNEDVYAVDVDNDRLTRLTDHPGRDTSPACGPGGRVVFASSRAPALNLFIVTIP